MSRAGLIATTSGNRLQLYRRRGGRWEHWRTIQGDAGTRQRALSAARAVSQWAADAGGWDVPLAALVRHPRPVSP